MLVRLQGGPTTRLSCCFLVITLLLHRERRCLRSSTDKLSYSVPPTRTKLGERAFSVAGQTAWNPLPYDIRRISDIRAFKDLTWGIKIIT